MAPCKEGSCMWLQEQLESCHYWFFVTTGKASYQLATTTAQCQLSPFFFTPLFTDCLCLSLSLSQLVRVTIKGNMNVLRVCSSLICIESLTIRLLSVSVPPYLPIFPISAFLFSSFCFRPRNMTYFCTQPSKGNFH